MSRERTAVIAIFLFFIILSNVLMFFYTYARHVRLKEWWRGWRNG